MKNMTKRDVADITLVWVGLTFVLSLLGSLVSIGVILFMQENQGTNMTIAVPMQTLHVVALLVLSWFLLFRRKMILDLLFPDADQTAIVLSDEAHLLTDYTFWIKLVGIIICLSSGIGFISRLGTVLAARREYVAEAFWWTESGPELISAILAIVIIWKADRVTELVQKIASSNK